MRKCTRKNGIRIAHASSPLSPLSKQLTVKQTLLGWKRKRFQPNNIIYFNFNKIEKIHARGLNLL